MATLHRSKGSTSLIGSAAGFLLLLANAVPAIAQDTQDTFAEIDRKVKVKGFAQIQDEIRSQAGKGLLGELLNAEPWTVEYMGTVPPESVLTVQLIPAEAFRMERVDATTFRVRLEDHRALVTAHGQLKNLGVRLTQTTANAIAMLRSASGEARPGTCRINVKFRLNGSGTDFDFDKTGHNNYRLSVMPPGAAILAGVRGAEAHFQRNHDAPATVTLELADPELGPSGWTSYVSDLATCTGVTSAGTPHGLGAR